MEFLRALNLFLDPSGTHSADSDNTHAAAIEAKSKTAKAKAGKGKSAGGGRVNPLQSLAVLGLAYHHLTKKTVACLEVCNSYTFLCSVCY